MGLDFEAIIIFLPRLLQGAMTTVALTVAILAFATPLALIIAIFRYASGGVVNGVFTVIGWFMRGVPPLLVLLTVFFVPSSFGFNIHPFTSATIAMITYMTFYFAEVFRGGLLNVPKGQFQAADSLGMSRMHMFRRIIVPQALPAVAPPYISHACGLLKGTSLASAVAVPELMRASKEIFSVNYMPLQVLLVSGVIYALLSSILFYIQSYYERAESQSWARR